jgi:hypothetical protein
MNQHKDFVEDYRRTWEQVMNVGEVASLTRFFNIPYFAVGADGTVTLVKSEAEVRSFNQACLDQFQRETRQHAPSPAAATCCRLERRTP